MASGLAGLYNKLVQLLQTAPRGALSITGILGLALLVYGYLQLRDTNRAEQQRREQQARERQRLAGAKRVTLSIPGVLLAESSPAQLQESASVQLEALEAVREMARVSDVYLLAHVEDDVGEAVVAGALEAAGLLGAGAGQVAPHHLLCCSTLDGKVPIVRQLDPDLHVDGHAVSVDELKRFLPRLLLVREDAGSGSGGSGNVGLASSLRAFFGA
eukprot:XP_001695457.1 predicted protein [Chlamydomonas reinhardtii]